MGNKPVLTMVFESDAHLERPARTAGAGEQRRAADRAVGAVVIAETFDVAEGNVLPAQLAHEAAAQSRLADRPAFSEGVRAFLEKRAPRFDGR